MRSGYQYYRGYKIEVINSFYRLVLYPNIMRESWEEITQAIDEIIKNT